MRSVSCCIQVHVWLVWSWSDSKARSCAEVTPGSASDGALPAADDPACSVAQPAAASVVMSAKTPSLFIEGSHSQRLGQRDTVNPSAKLMWGEAPETGSRWGSDPREEDSYIVGERVG